MNNDNNQQFRSNEQRSRSDHNTDRVQPAPSTATSNLHEPNPVTQGSLILHPTRYMPIGLNLNIDEIVPAVLNRSYHQQTDGSLLPQPDLSHEITCSFDNLRQHPEAKRNLDALDPSSSSSGQNTRGSSNPLKRSGDNVNQKPKRQRLCTMRSNAGRPIHFFTYNYTPPPEPDENK